MFCDKLMFWDFNASFSCSTIFCYFRWISYSNDCCVAYNNRFSSCDFSSTITSISNTCYQSLLDSNQYLPSSKFVSDFLVLLKDGYKK